MTLDSLTKTRSSSATASRSGFGATDSPPSHSPSPAPRPRGDREPRAEWPRELFQWFEADRRATPDPSDPYWRAERVFVRRISLVELPTASGNHLGDLRLELKVQAVDDNRLWDCFKAHETELRDRLHAEVKRATNGRITIEEVAFHRGSISIILLLKAASAAIAPFMGLLALLSLLITIVANYAAIKAGLREIYRDARRAIEAIEAVLKELFRLWLGPDGLNPI